MLKGKIRIVLAASIMLFVSLAFFVGMTFCEKEHNASQTPTFTSASTNSYYIFITLIDGHQEALLNGDSISLGVAPFIRGGAFYYPLQPVVEALGGTYAEQEGTAEIYLSGHEVSFQVGAAIIIIDGTVYKSPETMCEFSMERKSVRVGEDISPRLSQGVFYVPNGIIPKECPDIGLNYAREDPEMGSIIFLRGDQNESGIDAVKLKDSYLALSKDFRSSLKDAGIIGTVAGYDIEKYQNDDIEVYVMRNSNNEEDIEDMDGKVCAIQLLSSKYNTPRGLRVGDSPYRACMLYGRDSLSYTFSYFIEDGAVASISFYTHYYSFNNQ